MLWGMKATQWLSEGLRDVMGRQRPAGRQSSDGEGEEAAGMQAASALGSETIDVLGKM